MFRCKLDPRQLEENQDIRKGVGRRRQPNPLWRRPEAASLILLQFLCVLGLGVEFTFKEQYLIFGKHAQELYVDF